MPLSHTDPTEEELRDEMADLYARINKGAPADWLPPPPSPKRIPKPMYWLEVDDADERSIILIIRTGKDGVTRAMIALPAWEDLPEIEEGPYRVREAIRLANNYAYEYDYRGIAIDIESSQLWDRKWGKLETPPADFD